MFSLLKGANCKKSIFTTYTLEYQEIRNMNKSVGVTDLNLYHLLELLALT